MAGATLRGVGLPGSLLRACAFGIALVAALEVHAAPANFGSRLDNIEVRLAEQEDTLGELSENYSNRSGLIGVSDARQRYEDAVYAYLMGDYDRAASEFFVLVESKALGESALHDEAEWYLASVLFDQGNLGLAEEWYNVILMSGSGHAFRDHAVRQMFDLYSRQIVQAEALKIAYGGDPATEAAYAQATQRFQELYDRYVGSGLIAVTDLVRYTLAKAYYMQGRVGQAKSIFSAFEESSPVFAKSRYFLGVILLAQGEGAAAADEFLRASKADVVSPEVRQVVDLANLAYARVMLEVGDYKEAVEYYNRIGRDSEYFADQLHELVWTFIKQEEYEQALRSVEIFLLGFSDHKYRPRVEVLGGHLHIKQLQYADAIKAYDEVIKQYTPVRDLALSVRDDAEKPAAFFERLVDSPSGAGLEAEGLPDYAGEMLIEDSAVRKAIDLKRELDSETDQLALCRQIIADLEAALVDESGTLGAFQETRRSLLALRTESLTLADSLVTLESDFIASDSDDDVGMEILRQERSVVAGRVAEIRADTADKADRYDVYLDQVRAVQSVAFKVDQVAQDLLQQIDANRNYLNSGQPSLSTEEVESVQQRLQVLEADVTQIVAEVAPLWGESLRQQFALLVPVADEEKTADEAVASDLSNLRSKLKQRRGEVSRSDARTFFSQIDAVWSRTDAIYQQANATLERLDAVERDEIARIRLQLAKYATEVTRLEQEVALSRNDALDVGTGVTRAAFGSLADFFLNAVERADIGIVDVYWSQKMETAERMDSLKEERADLEFELSERFRQLRERMGEE